jgi:hypothetical protein
LVLILEAQNQKQAAVREFQAVLRIDPQFREARRELTKLSAPGR